MVLSKRVYDTQLCSLYCSLYLSHQKGKALLRGVQQTTVHESGCKKLKNTESLYSDRHKMEGPKEIQFLKDNKLYHNTQAGRNIL